MIFRFFTTLLFRLLIMMGVIVLAGCNLGARPSETPPTLAPRASATPPPTLGVASSGAGSQFIPGNVQTPIADPNIEVYQILNQVETDRLMSHIASLQGFYTRHVNSEQNSPTRGIGAARAYINDQFTQIQQASNGRLYTFPHEFELNYNGVRTRQFNIVAVVQGTEAGAGTLVVGAHYDSIGPDFNDGTIYAPGANDNGTGIAAIIELARILSQRQYRSSIMIVAFSAEEIGRRGSIAFVRYLLDRNIDVIGMINVDGIGSIYDRQGRRNDSELYVFSAGPNDTSISRHMARTAEFISFTHNLPLKLILQDSEDREGRYGDHFSFSEVGYPAIRFINAFELKRNADPTDTIEFVDPEYLRKATQSLLLVTTAMADGPRPPRNVALRDRSDGLSSLIWEEAREANGYVIALRWPGSLRYDQQIVVNATNIDWDGFRNYAGIAVAARGRNGLVGPLSKEYAIPR